MKYNYKEDLRLWLDLGNEEILRVSRSLDVMMITILGSSVVISEWLSEFNVPLNT